jgi:predicted enzyme related to lactoylglutathione lyase
VPEFSSHAPGTFCWPELATTDQKGAVDFYRALFGWDVVESPIGPTETYSMFNINGKNVGGAYSMRAEELQHGVPPHWNAYVMVANADEAVKRAQALGANVLAPAFDVMDAGRMAVLQDPTGASFCVWQAGKHSGAALLRETGALCWTELATRDTKAAEQFYTSLFGWTAKTGTDGGMEYTEFSNQGTGQAGMMPMVPQMGDAPPYWMPYFAVADCDVAVAKTKDLGGQIYMPPADIPKVGRFAVLADPQGAPFAVIKVERA